MATILSIETSADVCSTALSSDGFLLLHREEWEGHNHAARLSGFIKDCLDHLRDHNMTLDAVAVSLGPGSYTGLRIGMSEAKGLCYALRVPLIGVSTLEAMTAKVMFGCPDLPEGVLYCPMVDARRQEVYTATYDNALRALDAPAPLVLDEAGDSIPPRLLARLSGAPVAFFGSGAPKAVERLRHPAAIFLDGIVPLASDMMALAEKAWMQKDFLDVAYSVPTYLKAFQGTRPGRKL